jgi:hypothetical protein
MQANECLQERGVLQSLGLEHGDANLFRSSLDWELARLLTAASRTISLGDDADNGVA